jgi:hypothetical protein
MALHSDKNLYPGINPHLNSFLQDEDGGWESFHAQYIVGIANALDKQLPSNYYALAEKSLQVSEIGLGEEQQRRTRPDISIYRVGASSGVVTAASTAPSAVLPLAPTLEDEDDLLTAVVVYEIEKGSLPGKPVTRIEVLSPGNKPPLSNYRQYLAKRLQTLRSGLTLVEIDFLHESRPVINLLPSYPDGDEDSVPYTIVVSDPHPAPEKGQMALYNFGVDDAIPPVSIPLAGKETTTLDFGAIYDALFESVRVYKLIVDYEQEPVHFERYTDADQQRIRQRMAAIQAQFAEG